MLLFWVLLPGTFMTGRNLMNVSQQVSMLAVTAFAMTIVMAMGDYDLSVGSMASLGGIVAAVTGCSREIGKRYQTRRASTCAGGDLAASGMKRPQADKQ